MTMIFRPETPKMKPTDSKLERKVLGTVRQDELEEDGGMLLIAVLSAVAMWVLVVRLRKQRARARRKRAAV